MPTTLPVEDEMMTIRHTGAWAMVGVALMCTLSAQGSAQADRQFQAALHKATVDGNLKGAIEDYRAIARRPGVSRDLASQALVRMAEAYQKLGDPQARLVYAQLIRDFPDQRQIVETARTRLTALEAPVAPTGLSLKRVHSGVGIISVSPDARWAVFNEFNEAANGVTGADLVLLDMSSGARRVLDKHPGTGAYVEGDAVFSPDGSQVAYHVAAIDKANNHELRIVPIDGSAAPRIVYESKNSNSEYVFVKGWTPDGRRLLISPELTDQTWQLAMLSIADGSLQTIKSFGWAQVHAALSPDGRYIAYAVPVRDDDVTRDLFVIAVDGSQEFPLVQHPAHDSDPMWSADGTHVLFRSNRPQRSSLWAIPVKNGRPAGDAVLVKDDVPIARPLGPQLPATVARSGALYYTVAQARQNVYHVVLGSDGKAVGEPRIATNREVNNDCCAAVSPDGQRLAYYSRSPRVLVIRELSTGSEQEFALNLEINFLVSTGPQWFPDGKSVMVHGSVPQRGGNRQYRVDLTSGRSELLPTNGISVHSRLAPDGHAILAGVNGLQWHDLRSREVTTLKPREANPFLSPTISPDGQQIAYWQRRPGKPATANISIASRTGTDERFVCVCDFPGTYSPMNMLAWTPDQRHLVFGDANGTLWRVPVSGGARESLGVTVPPRIQGLNLQPDGRGLFFTVADQTSPAELWVLENFLSGGPVR
jgi:Tol biopolymer transport system component